MAAITKKRAIVGSVGSLIVLIVGLLCWLVFSEKSYSKEDYIYFDGAIVDRSMKVVERIDYNSQSVSQEDGKIVVKKKFLSGFGIALVCVGGLGLVINGVGTYILASRGG